MSRKNCTKKAFHLESHFTPIDQREREGKEKGKKESEATFLLLCVLERIHYEAEKEI